MTITFIIGSSRVESNSAKIAHLISQVIPDAVTSNFIDLGKHPLPMWDEGVWAKTPSWQNILNPIHDQLSNSDGYVVIGPEYDGMVSPALKNFFNFCNRDLIAHKPGLIVGVSNSMGGSYPISELRASSYKNSRIVYVPDHLIFRNANDTPSNFQLFKQNDSHMAKRVEYSTGVFLEYVKYLKNLRDNTIFDFENFSHGM